MYKFYLALAALFFVTRPPGGEAASGAIKKAAWSQLCTLAQELKKTPGHGVHELTTLAANAEKAELAGLKLQVFLAKTDSTSQQTALIALSQQLLDEAADGVAQLKSKPAQAIEAATSTSDLRGRLAGFLQMLSEAGNADTAYCLSNTANSGNGRAELAALKCTEHIHVINPTIEQIPASAIGEQGLTAIRGEATAMESGTGDNKCAITTSGATPAQNLFTDAASTLLGLLTFTSNSATVLASKANGFDKSTRTADDLLKAAHYDALHQQARAAGTKSVDQGTIVRQAATEQKLLSRVKLLLALKVQGSPDKIDENQAKKLIADTFGVDAEAPQRLWEAVETTEVAGADSDNPKLSKPLNALTTATQLRQVLNYYEYLKAARLAGSGADADGNKKSKAAPTAANDATCAAKGLGDACKDGCKEITEKGERKCVVDKEEAKKVAEKATGTDAKTTNTTGSNSFVINKAPLWLAFLLF
uniref:Variant surface glycoprotein 636 n=1 Tax=Trypanosoma brucei TaxID=5691 RepID=M4T261_9TRYP|nr:variant surface glycoprotein 636 [Trypanosoma brucei]